MQIIGTILTAALILAGSLFLMIVQPGGDGVQAHLKLDDGSEYMVKQRCNWSAEPYTVGFYMRAPGQKWGWCYVDHEADRWRGVTLTHDTARDVIVIHQQGEKEGELDRKRGKLRLRHMTDEGDAPQSLLPDGATP